MNIDYFSSSIEASRIKSLGNKKCLGVLYIIILFSLRRISESLITRIIIFRVSIKFTVIIFYEIIISRRMSFL